MCTRPDVSTGAPSGPTPIATRSKGTSYCWIAMATAIEGQFVLLDRDCERVAEPVPTLPAFSPAREEDERPLQVMALDELLRAILLGNVHACARDLMGR